MSKFLTELEVRQIDDAKWLLVVPLKYQSAIYGGIITVPDGFVTDFASVPRVPFVFWLYGDRAHRESVVHDFLYQTNSVSRKMADDICLEAMKARNKGFFVRWGMWLGVRVGGRSAYRTGPERMERHEW